MILINKAELKKLEKNLKQKKNIEELIEYIEYNYNSKGDDFHRLFLHSGFLMGMSPKGIDVLLMKLSVNKDKNQVYIDTMEFIIHLLKRKKYYDKSLKEILITHSGHINVDGLFKCIEQINEKKLKGISMDDEIYPQYIVESQFNHIINSISEVIEFIRDNNIIKNNKQYTEKQLEVSNKIIRILSHKASIRSHLLSTMMELTNVKKILNYSYEGKFFDFIYFSRHNIDYWSQFEIYRNLNYILYNNYMENNDQIDLMKETGVIKNYSSELLHFDLSKSSEYYSSKTMYTAVKLLQPMYGNLEGCFSVGKEIFSINTLIEVLKKIYELQYNRTEFHDGSENKNKIIVYGEKALIRAAGISNEKVSLLRLLAFDINDFEQKVHLISFKPLICIGKVYYIVPSHFKNVSIEKCIDKILSSEVKILKHDNGKKGYNQLIERTRTLMDGKKRKIIEEKTKIDLENKKLAPFILSNHSYFNGYRNLTFIEDNKEIQIPIIDFRTLQKIITTKKVSLWTYDNKINKYRHSEKKYESAEELYAYLCDQIYGLIVEDSPTYQITEDSIAFKIVKPIEILINS